jgi:hypothetical protein
LSSGRCGGANEEQCCTQSGNCLSHHSPSYTHAEQRSACPVHVLETETYTASPESRLSHPRRRSAEAPRQLAASPNCRRWLTSVKRSWVTPQG